ncbi:MAG TPA: cytochrome b/b6 domain-containing protein [Candidatus Binataceae bacterium]|nr:cytochrome b/b6 domain-containing protein [Candidatus Binataceae bacterium]
MGQGDRAAPAHAGSDAPRYAPFHGRRQQPLPIRITHWCNAVFITLMAGSGLQILTAYPSMGPQGAQYWWYPFQGTPPPEWLRLGGWLGGGRHWHFAIAWFFIANGLIYLVYFLTSGEWRRRLFNPARDALNAMRQFAYYVRIRKSPPPEDFYNGLQRLAYTTALILGIVMVLSGLAIYKPVQFHPLTVIFGGYDGARVVHLGGLCLLALFLATHIVLVTMHPREIVHMVDGGPRG